MPSIYLIITFFIDVIHWLMKPFKIKVISTSRYIFHNLFFFFFPSKLRSSTHGQVLIHLCFSLIGLYVSFLLSSLIGSEYEKISARRPLCLTFSALLHYFFLVYFSLTVAQSILLYLKLVKVIGTANFLINYQFKIGMISWGE